MALQEGLSALKDAQMGCREGQPSSADFHPWIVEAWRSGQRRAAAVIVASVWPL
ncbi:MAG: hypothetical protein ACI906_000252 [Candidatus Latescibacterota bacterium]|jgi:hypothetical protein